jgi:predicted heme/steroid binding protein
VKEFTSKKSESFKEKEGVAAVYNSYEGRVYDVSESSLWSDGEHMGSQPL